jgi:monooxygenase
MFTLGYAFRPWAGAKAIADGPAILDYLRETAREHGIEPLIRYRHRVTSASWSSAEARWTVEVERSDGAAPLRLACSFLFLCSGYYRYDHGHAPVFPGRELFRGRVVHPQHWTDDIAWAGQRVLVIGSGATAVTLVPALAKEAAHVTMLQRSPTYVVAQPSRDRLARTLRRALPARWAHGLTRWTRILLGQLFFQYCRRWPQRARALLRRGVRARLGPDFDVDTHFSPRYNPWEQRLCLAPDGDLFRALRSGRASVVTDRIASFTERGVKLASGAELDADLIVTATGLELLALGGMRLVVDGREVDPAQSLQYKGAMLAGVPNLAQSFGYTNAAWTLKSDLTAEYVCRMLAFMRRHGYVQCTPRNRDPAMRTEPAIDFSSGYVQRAIDGLPRQGVRPPWRLHQNYLRDLWLLRHGRLADGAMEFARAPARPHQV